MAATRGERGARSSLSGLPARLAWGPGMGTTLTEGIRDGRQCAHAGTKSPDVHVTRDLPWRSSSGLDKIAATKRN